MDKKKMMAALGLLPFAAFGVDVGGSLGLETGIRADVLKSTTSDAGTEKVKHLDGISLGLNGRLTLNDFYIRAGGDYVWILRVPQFVDTTAAGVETTIGLTKEHGYDGYGAFGYTFYFNNGEFSLAPEAGYAYQSLDVTQNVTESAGSPFVGFDFNWMFACDWKFGLLFDWHLFGHRSSDVNTRSDKIEKITDGYYMGPEAKVSFDYSFTENWSAGVAYRFKYLFTNKKDIAGVTNEEQAWWSNNATVKVDYAF